MASASSPLSRELLLRFHEARLRRAQLEKEISRLEADLKAAELHQLVGDDRVQKLGLSLPELNELSGLPSAPLRFELDGRPIFVIDGFASVATVERVHSWASQLKFGRREGDSADTADVRTFAAEVPAEIRKTDGLFDEVDRAVKALFPGEQQKRYRVYVNCVVYGDSVYTHRDCPPECPDITVVYYVNREWKESWAGETIFCDDQGDSRFAVAPRPGRIVIFRGATPHRTGVPARDGYAERFTLAIKYSKAGGL